MRIQKIIYFVLAGLILIIPVFSYSQKVGVGVNRGRIDISENLKPGDINYLPSVGVVNTGDIASNYVMSLGFMADQEELRLEKDWLNFSPSQFYLEPNKSQSVRIILSLPINATPGDYFVLLQASPVKEIESGTQIGVAAATKLYFTVVPANIFQAIYNRIIVLYSLYNPWSTIILSIIFLAIIFTFLGKKFKIQVSKK